MYPARERAEWLCGLTSSSGVDLGGAWRATRAGQVHLTLLFLGDRDARDVPEIEQSVERSCAGIEPFSLAARRIMTLPTRGPAKVVAVETDAPPALLELQRRLVTRLATRGKRDTAFLPHITIARFAGAGARLRCDVGIAGAEPIEMRSVVLVRSVLKRDGAEHAAMACVELGARG